MQAFFLKIESIISVSLLFDIQWWKCNILISAQARLKYGPNFIGELPEPIAIHFVNTNGSKFHFSVFQLNTLDLNSDIKNIFWHQPQMEKLFDTCEYVNAVPTIEGYNHLIFNKLLGIYLQFNAREIQKWVWAFHMHWNYRNLSWRHLFIPFCISRHLLTINTLKVFKK